MAQKVAVINMKGGVGKSTLAANLAWEMASDPWNKDVLVIDLDPQFNCSQYLLGVDTINEIISSERPTVWDIFEQLTSLPGRSAKPISPMDAVFQVHHSARHGSIDLIPSQLELSQTLRNPSGKEQLLKQAVERLEEHYDLIVIDCPPTESVLTNAAYLTANHILVPVRPEFLSAIGLPLLEQSLNEFRIRYPSDCPEILGLVFNAISGYSPEETTSKREVRDIAQKNNWPIFAEEVVYSKSFPKSAREGNPIFWTTYARTATKRNFHRFAREFARRIAL